MKNFSSGDTAIKLRGRGTNNVLQIGMAPGEFDTKQIVLCVLAMMASEYKCFRFVRTFDKSELKYCMLTITDDTVNSIPVYNKIDRVWEARYIDIVRNLDLYAPAEYLLEAVKKDLYNLENFDIIRVFNQYKGTSSGFDEALRVCQDLIKAIIISAASEYMYACTIMSDIEKASGLILELSINCNYKNTLEKHPKRKSIDYVIIPEENNLVYRIECTEEDVDVRKLVKGYERIASSGRYFAKVNSLENAYIIIEQMRAKKSKLQFMI